ncbi:MAG: NAD-dependent epimerase/dehydratase family protein [Steroidobacterales bacterium]
MGQVSDQDFAGIRCVVTGANGFIGTALCQQLRAGGAQVHGLCRADMQPSQPYRLRCDVRDGEQVRAAFAQTRPQVVFHLASIVSGSQSLGLILPMLQSNLVGFLHVALAAAEYKCDRVITIGSLMEPDITLPAVPSSPYAASKFAASCYARMFSDIYDLPVAIARLMMVYGPGQMDTSKLVPYIGSQLVSGRPAELSSGQQQFDWIYIDDVIDALLAIATRPDVQGRSIDVGTGALTSVAHVAQGIARRFGRIDLLKLGAIPDRKAEPTRIADVGATAALLGWQPRVALQEGLDRTAAWLAANPFAAGH